MTGLLPELREIHAEGGGLTRGQVGEVFAEVDRLTALLADERAERNRIAAEAAGLRAAIDGLREKVDLFDRLAPVARELDVLLDDGAAGVDMLEAINGDHHARGIVRRFQNAVQRVRDGS